MCDLKPKNLRGQNKKEWLHSKSVTAKVTSDCECCLAGDNNGMISVNTCNPSKHKNGTLVLHVIDELTISFNSESEYRDRNDSDSMWFSTAETERVFLDPKDNRLRTVVIIVHLAAKINPLTVLALHLRHEHNRGRTWVPLIWHVIFVQRFYGNLPLEELRFP
jgi:hypothetical protein